MPLPYSIVTQIRNYTNENPTFDTPHDIRGQNREDHFCPTSSCPQNPENPSRFCIYTIKTPHLIHNIIVEIKMGSSFLPFIFAPALAQRGGRESALKNSLRFGIYTNENPVSFLPLPFVQPLSTPNGGGGGGGGQFFKVHPDLESTPLKTLHLIPH